LSSPPLRLRGGAATNCVAGCADVVVVVDIFSNCDLKKKSTVVCKNKGYF